METNDPRIEAIRVKLAQQVVDLHNRAGLSVYAISCMYLEAAVASGVQAHGIPAVVAALRQHADALEALKAQEPNVEYDA